MTITAAPAIYTGTVRQARIGANEHVTYVPAHVPEGTTKVVVPAAEDEQEHLNEIRVRLSRLWSRDWDSEEDAAYDQW